MIRRPTVLSGSTSGSNLTTMVFWMSFTTCGSFSFWKGYWEFRIYTYWPFLNKCSRWNCFSNFHKIESFFPDIESWKQKFLFVILFCLPDGHIYIRPNETRKRDSMHHFLFFIFLNNAMFTYRWGVEKKVRFYFHYFVEEILIQSSNYMIFQFAIRNLRH